MNLRKEFKNLEIGTISKCLRESFDLDYQLTLPQYLDDIEKIVKCSVSSCVVDYEINANSVTAYGKTLISITYLNSDNMMLSHIFEEEFKKNFDVKNDDSIRNVNIELCQRYSSFRPINQRRIDVHQAVNAVICVYSSKALTALVKCENAFTDEYKPLRLSVKESGITGIEFDELFSIENGSNQIKSIVNCFCRCFIDDIKIIKEKMLVKINCHASIVYENSDSNIQKYLYSFTASKIIDIPNCNENDRCFADATLSSVYVKAKSNSGNEISDVEFVGRISITYKLYETSEEAFVRDSYSPVYETSLSRDSINILSNTIYYSDERNAQLVFENDKSIIEVLDLTAGVTSCKIEKSNLIATIKLCYLYFDDKSELSYFEEEQEYKLKLCDNELDGDAVVKLISFDYVIKNSNAISLKINFCYSSYLYENESLNFVSDIECTGERNEDERPELILYFANENEAVWDIAKRFSTDSRLIIEENDLTDEIITGKRVLLVPGV